MCFLIVFDWKIQPFYKWCHKVWLTYWLSEWLTDELLELLFATKNLETLYIISISIQHNIANEKVPTKAPPQSTETPSQCPRLCQQINLVYILLPLYLVQWQSSVWSSLSPATEQRQTFCQLESLTWHIPVPFMFPSWTCWIFSHFLTWTVSKREPWWEPGLVVGGEQAGVGVEDQQQEQGLQHLGHEEIFSLHCPASTGLSVAFYWTNEMFWQNFPPE